MKERSALADVTGLFFLIVGPVSIYNYIRYDISGIGFYVSIVGTLAALLYFLPDVISLATAQPAQAAKPSKSEVYVIEGFQ